MSVLVINSGSSSIKYQLVDPNTAAVIVSGLVERIGEEIAHVEHTHDGETTTLDLPIPDHKDGLKKILELFDEFGPHLGPETVSAVGHRVVQGGKYFDKAALITDEVQRNMGGVLASRNSPLEMRREACKQINAMFGLNVDVDFREDILAYQSDIIGKTMEDVEEGGNL